MYIRIINKNRIANNNTFEDFQKYGVDEGAVYTTNYNEELDSMSLRLSNLPSEIDIEPFDRVAIYHSNNTIFNVMCVNYSENTMNGYVGDATYSYDISLFSLTKELENYRLPSLSITPHKTGTQNTILSYIQNYLSMYVPTGRYVISDEVIARFGSINAPELQWNEPTLREVLTSLFMVDDKIPVLKWRNNRVELYYLDLTEEGNEITTYNYIKKSRSADNYVSELRMDMQNVMQKDSVVSTSEFIPLTSNDYILTSDNVLLKTKYPILNIKKLMFNVVRSGSELCSFDLSNCVSRVQGDLGGSLIYEKKEYDTLEKLYKVQTLDTIHTLRVDNYFSKYQNFCLYYTRGGNSIDGLTKQNKFALGVNAPTTLQWLQILAGQFKDGNSHSAEWYGVGTIVDNAYYSCYFYIEYETQYDQVFQASKEGKQHHRVITDNQTNSWVDATIQGNLEYQKANRLGNEIWLINQRVDSMSNAADITDKKDDHIVYQVQYKIYTDHIDVNAFATLNYILQDYWTGINSKVRTWRNAQDEAFRRNELKKYYCVFDTKAHNDTNIVYNQLNRAMMSPLDELAHNTPIRHVGYRANLKNNVVLPEGSESGMLYLDNVLSRVIGKSMIFTFTFDDNWIVGLSPNMALSNVASTSGFTPHITKAYTDENGGVSLKPQQYVDDNGELTSISYYLANNMYVSWDDVNDVGVLKSGMVGSNLDVAKKFCVWTFNKPLAIDDTINNFKVFNDQIVLHKDNKEIPTINTQFEFISASSDILVTNEYVKLHKWVANYDTGKTVKVYGGNALNLRSNQLPSNASQLVGVSLQIDYTGNNRAKISIPSDNYKYHYITVDDKLVLAFKGNEVYMNILTNRDTNIYNSQGVITGEI